MQSLSRQKRQRNCLLKPELIEEIADRTAFIMNGVMQ